MKRILGFLFFVLCYSYSLHSQNLDAPKPLELPAVIKGSDIFVHIGYASLYNRETLIPDWVAYELTADEVNPPEKLRGRESFRYDPETEGVHTAYREDYYNEDGWQRGHMAPKADMRWSVQAYEESFYFSNVCPQDGTLNGGDWLTTERLARRMAERYGNVYIICGPVIGTNKYGTLGENKVVIPDAFFKALLLKVEGQWQSIGMILPNEPTHHQPEEYWLTINELEIKIGLDLFPGLDDSIEEIVEDQIDKSIWSR